ncbi:hypothetical protein ZPAH1_orf00395 [Aeromonas phage ZPAH1]|nr:hypothetical protein ZPAH1_orf00395 [Aeromonas phage ZPAH1]
MKLKEVQKIPTDGYFVVTGISPSNFPFGVSILAKDGIYYEYDENDDAWSDELEDLYFNSWSDLKFFVIQY